MVSYVSCSFFFFQTSTGVKDTGKGIHTGKRSSFVFNVSLSFVAVHVFYVLLESIYLPFHCAITRHKTVNCALFVDKHGIFNIEHVGSFFLRNFSKLKNEKLWYPSTYLQVLLSAFNNAIINLKVRILHILSGVLIASNNYG